jgi:hypothetical protein
MEKLAERLFWWLFRPFLGRRSQAVPEGVSDEELIRRGARVGAGFGSLIWVVLMVSAFAWFLVMLNTWLGLKPVRQPDDIHFSTSSVWFGAVFMSGGLLILFSVAIKTIQGAGLSKAELALVLEFEAKHKVNARHAYAFLGVAGFALGAVFASVADDYVAFDSQALRWRHFFTTHLRPISDIAEVRFYRRHETPRGELRERETACVLFKDGTRFLSSDGFMKLAMTKADSGRLAEVAGVPAQLDLDVLPHQP